jgi:hypothetical protein
MLVLLVSHISLSSKYNDVISFVSYSIMLVVLVSHISLSSKYNDVISFVLLSFNCVDHLVLSCVCNIYLCYCRTRMNLHSFVSFGLFLIWNNWPNFKVLILCEKYWLGYNFLSFVENLHIFHTESILWNLVNYSKLKINQN